MLIPSEVDWKLIFLSLMTFIHSGNNEYFYKTETVKSATSKGNITTHVWWTVHLQRLMWFIPLCVIIATRNRTNIHNAYFKLGAITFLFLIRTDTLANRLRVLDYVNALNSVARYELRLSIFSNWHRTAKRVLHKASYFIPLKNSKVRRGREA